MITDTYRPTNLTQVVGVSDSEKSRLKDWLNNWSISNLSQKKSLYIEGNAGVGKSSLVDALANDCDYRVIEYNSSSDRSLSVLKSKIEPQLYSQSVFEEKKLLLFEEIDGLSGDAESGAVSYVCKLIDKTAIPIVFIANDYSRSLIPIQNKSYHLKMKNIREDSIVKRLREVAELEIILVTDDELQDMAQNSHGDMRTALNSLESYITGKTRDDNEMPIYNVLEILFSDTQKEALDKLDRLSTHGDYNKIVLKIYDYISEMLTTNKIEEDVAVKILHDLAFINMKVKSAEFFTGIGRYDRKLARQLLSSMYIGSNKRIFIMYPKKSLYLSHLTLKSIRKNKSLPHMSLRKACLHRLG